MDLPASVTELVRGATTFYLVGTAHVSRQSIDDVIATIEAVEPELVCVELDVKRHASLTKNDAFRELDVIAVIREGRAVYLVAQLALAAYQNKIGARLGVRPGAEMLAAIDAARARSLPVELIDRDIAVTLMRTWRNLGPMTRALLVISLAATLARGDANKPVDVEQLKEPKALSDMLAEIGRAMPQVKAPLIDERDQYMVSKLVELGEGKRSVIAVVGAAHVPGMVAYADETIVRGPLEQVPPPSRGWRVAGQLFPLAFLLVVVWGWSRGDTSLARLMLGWILPTAIGAAVLTALVRGTPAAIATSLIVAPIAAIHPTLKTGQIAGVVQARFRPANAADRERLVTDLQSFRGFRTNPLSRALLVAAAAGLGTTIGFVVGVIRVAFLL
ncbi:MAG TPA: TraB/GumN family protein [Kofleriaceae bacterium]|nr:TraB/GumN family protein [Kofleriaceae bacterium]